MGTELERNWRITIAQIHNQWTTKPCRAIVSAQKIAESQLEPFIEAMTSLYEKIYTEMTEEEKKTVILFLIKQKEKEKERIDKEIVSLYASFDDLCE